MALIDEVRSICERLAPGGWHGLLLQHGLDIRSADLHHELGKPLQVDRTLKGFEDFSTQGDSGIAARQPARSLLYHALASPNVTTDASGTPLQLYPSAAEIETVLNYVYGMHPPSLADVQRQAGGAPLAIAVFASEYRPGPETVHRHQADLCFSRSGVARIGTAPALYDRQRRGFLPFVEGDRQAMRVIPARYSAYIAVKQKGDYQRFGPMNFQADIDPSLDFWVPLHKLFSGPECLDGLVLTLELDNHQINEKIKQIHVRFSGTGWQAPDIDNPPFVMTEGLAQWAPPEAFGQGLLIPVARNRLVEPAFYKGEPLTFMMPAGTGGLVHGRHKVLADGRIEDLNDSLAVDSIVKAGGYRAVHYQDAMADGWVRARCPQLEPFSGTNVAAYSILGAPDFFPLCGQRELKEWAANEPLFASEQVWHTRLDPLSDVRFYANQSLKGEHFSVEDRGVTAIVSLPLERLDPPSAQLTAVALAQRQSWLPDFASGVFGPGWEIGRGTSNSPFLNMLCGYQLASPFTEDVRICAALGSYWPGVSPDSTRTFEPRSVSTTIIPLTDEEMLWDGVHGPVLLELEGRPVAQYRAYEYTDYTQAALAGELSLHGTAQTTTAHYHQRVMAMYRAYNAVGAGVDKEQRRQWPVLSFILVQRPDADLEIAQQESGVVLQGEIQHFYLYKRGEVTTAGDEFKYRHVEVRQQVRLFVSAQALLIKWDQDPWRLEHESL